MSRTASSAQPRPAKITGTQLATAFDGKLERVGVSIGYHIGILLVAAVMVLLPLVYFAIIAAAVWLVWFHATHSIAIFEHARGRAVLLLGVVYIAPIIAGGVLVIFMLLPLFWRSSKGPRPLWVERREQPLLYAYIDQLCDAMRVPRPVRIDVIAAPNASAHIDNGLLGIFRRRLVLTIGLPLVTAMNLKQFTGVMAHEFGHFAQGSSMRLSYIVHRINNWFGRLAYERTGLDDTLDATLDEESHWSIMLINGLCKLSLGIVRLILRTMALISHAISMHLSRQAEFDADRKAARIVGSEPMCDALQLLPFICTAHSIALDRARDGWNRAALPDDLVLLTCAVNQNLPDKLKQSIDADILTAEASWFDTHPPLYKRVAALKKARLQGVLKLDAPARILFKDYDELCKLATIDFYQAVIGDNLRPEHLCPVVVQPDNNGEQVNPRPGPQPRAVRH